MVSMISERICIRFAKLGLPLLSVGQWVRQLKNDSDFISGKKAASGFSFIQRFLEGDILGGYLSRSSNCKFLFFFNILSPLHV